MVKCNKGWIAATTHPPHLFPTRSCPYVEVDQIIYFPNDTNGVSTPRIQSTPGDRPFRASIQTTFSGHKGQSWRQPTQKHVYFWYVYPCTHRTPPLPPSLTTLLTQVSGTPASPPPIIFNSEDGTSQERVDLRIKQRP